MGRPDAKNPLKQPLWRRFLGYSSLIRLDFSKNRITTYIFSALFLPTRSCGMNGVKKSEKNVKGWRVFSRGAEK